MSAPRVSGPNAGPAYNPYPTNNRGANQMVALVQKYLAQNFPNQKIGQRLTLVPGSTSLRGQGVLADSNAHNGLIRWHDSASLAGLNQLGQTQRYMGSAQEREAVQLLLHEMNHQVGPIYGNRGQDRFWEEGLAEAVSRDQAPGFARSLRNYVPSPPASFEDGSVHRRGEDDFNFAPVANHYPERLQAVDQLAFYAAARQQPGWAGRVDPGRSPAADSFRRRMLQEGTGGRIQMVRAERQAQAAARQAPGYARQTFRQVGSIAGAAAQAAGAPASHPALARAVARRVAPAAARAPQANVRFLREGW